MRVERTEEQQELASIVRRLLERESADPRAVADSERGYDERLWATLCEQVGVAALAVSEEHDGAGATVAESFVVLEELGRTLGPTPLLGSVVAAAALRSVADDRAGDLLPRVAAGEVVAVALDGGPVPYADTADLVLAATADGLVLVEDPEVDPVPTMDPLLRCGRLRTTEGRVIADEAAVECARDVATVGTACLAVGLLERCLELTVDYSEERVQFGRPIGSFQALKHRMADLHVLVETSRSIARAAANAVADGSVEADRLVASAASWVGEALPRVAGEMVQLHGGVAITWEHDAHLWFKRAHALATQLGQPHHRRARLAELGG